MRIAVFSIDPVIGEALACLFTHAGPFEVVASLSSLGAADLILDAQKPDMLLFTEDFDDEANRMLIKRLKQVLNVPTLLLHARIAEAATTDPIFDYVQSRWIGAGGVCQVIRNILPTKTPHQSKRSIESSITQESQPEAPMPGKRRRLSVRLKEISEQIAQGKSNREISELLAIAEPTVKVYVSKLLKNYGCANRVQLAFKLRGIDGEPAPVAINR